MEHKLKKDIEIIAQDGNWKLLKNPPSIKLTSPYSRGVITESGDLYIENKSEKIHHDLLRILYDKGLIKGMFSKGWNRSLPSDSGFLTVQRFKNTPHIAIGESNRIMYDEGDYNLYLPHFNVFIEAARKKNPSLSFTNKLVGMKFARLKESSGLHNNSSYFKHKKDHFME
jgi:hypothetical protein